MLYVEASVLSPLSLKSVPEISVDNLNPLVEPPTSAVEVSSQVVTPFLCVDLNVPALKPPLRFSTT